MSKKAASGHSDTIRQSGGVTLPEHLSRTEVLNEHSGSVNSPLEPSKVRKGGSFVFVVDPPAVGFRIIRGMLVRRSLSVNTTDDQELQLAQLQSQFSTTRVPSLLSKCSRTTDRPKYSGSVNSGFVSVRAR
ncbi:hypothetical protein WA026_012866 [Henosepilachna vigintioctopunctata]|uniref:Uncharacterized protein n=1 Tax=Henosepilachna vigintioctopunctata TaxID=420089 RepID=A0AAW1TMG2_9CUCU